MKTKKTMTPGQLVLNRFRRNKLAKLGFFILIFMFLFAFLGPVCSPYEEGQIFLSRDGSELLLY